jgi:hypothetical protein
MRLHRNLIRQLVIYRPHSLANAIEEYKERVGSSYIIMGEPIASWQLNLFGPDDALVVARIQARRTHELSEETSGT